jgi:hypothetical protein
MSTQLEYTAVHRAGRRRPTISFAPDSPDSGVRRDDAASASWCGTIAVIHHHRERGHHTMNSMRATVTLIVAGGGTGGHTYPALTTIGAVRDLLARQGATLEVTWIGTAAGLESRRAAEHGIPFIPITTGKLRRTRDLQSARRNLADAVRVPLGIIQALVAVARVRPDVVLTTGVVAAGSVSRAGRVALGAGVVGRGCLV